MSRGEWSLAIKSTLDFAYIFPFLALEALSNKNSFLFKIRNIFFDLSLNCIISRCFFALHKNVSYNLLSESTISFGLALKLLT